MKRIKATVPRDAATVILTREPGIPGTSWECFMVRRPAASDFASNVYVFPGGKIDASDGDPDVLQYVTHEPLPAGQGVTGPTEWTAIKVAALRELFEEAGVLLADRAKLPLVFTGELERRFDSYRDRLQSGDASLLDVVRVESLLLRTDMLHPFAHWITPEPFPRRYDTWFFVARLPEGQEPLHHFLETTEGLWISPRTALDRFERGDFPLVFATQKQLERMAAFDSVQALIEGTTESDLRAVIPRVVHREEETFFLLPGDTGYQG